MSPVIGWPPGLHRPRPPSEESPADHLPSSGRVPWQTTSSVRFQIKGTGECYTSVTPGEYSLLHKCHVTLGTLQKLQKLQKLVP
eukprot:696320-Prorocentrum_minimum.AAC.1